jgi:hypothetical protein
MVSPSGSRCYSGFELKIAGCQPHDYRQDLLNDTLHRAHAKNPVSKTRETVKAAEAKGERKT